MKVIYRNYGLRMTTEERQVARSQAADMTTARGTGRRPLAPRDLFVQSGPRGVLLNWRAPAGFSDDIAGWRVYKDDEQSLFCEINDPNTTQHFIETTAGSNPPVTNLFVSSINKLGAESPLVAIQGSALVEAGAPTMPGTPPTYTKDRDTCFSGNTLVITKDGAKPISEVMEQDEVLTQRGWRKVGKLLIHTYSGPMCSMGRGELVTPTHRFWYCRSWERAIAVFVSKMVEKFTGSVFNLKVLGDGSDEEQCYTLANGWIAHNLRKL